MSETGGAALAVALPVLALDSLGASDAEWSYISAARWVPYVVLGLVIGALVERRRRRPVLVVTDLVRGVLLVSVPVLWWADALSLWTLGAVLVAFGTVTLGNDAASQSMVPRLVARHRLVEANARLDQSATVAGLLGQPVGGALARAFSAPAAVLVSAVGYLVSAALVWQVRVAEPPPPRDRLRWRPFVADAADGLRWAYGHRMLRPLALSTHVWFLCQGIAVTVLPLLALNELGLNAFQLSLVFASAGMAGLVGALLAVPVGRTWGAGPTVAAARGLTAVAWGTVALTPAAGATAWDGVAWAALSVLVAGQALNGLAMGTENANEMGYRQAVTPDRLQSRTNSVLRSTNRAALLVGALLGGTVVVPLAGGYRGALWVAAAGFAVTAVGLALSPFRRARH